MAFTCCSSGLPDWSWNGLDPYAYLSDVLKRLPTHKVTQIEELLPHCWKPKSN
ncbi:transposase domain-containing protein [Acinetobacter baumannii]|nr:transposase domain-containing protein [Acinetobacter baumannii]WSI13519.1 transposase domain-containing protein [Acinetobacter baumannii]